MYTTVPSALLPSALAAPLINVDRANAITEKWIEKLKGDVTSQAEDGLRASISTKPDWKYAMPGFGGLAGNIYDQELARLQASEHVGWTLGLICVC